MLFVQPNVRVGVGWIETPPAAAAGLEELAGGLEPFPAPTVVRVDLEPGYAADPAPYLALVGSLPEGAYPSAKTPRVSLDLVTAEPSPWTPRGARVQLSYAPEERVILADTGWRQVPPELAALIERDAASEPPGEPVAEPVAAPQPAVAAVPAAATAGTDGFPWGLVRRTCRGGARARRPDRRSLGRAQAPVVAGGDDAETRLSVGVGS